MVIADLVSRLTVKWNEEMFTIISKSFLEPSNFMCSSCRPTLLPTMEEFRSWCSHLAFWPVPRLLPAVHSAFWSTSVGNAPMFNPFLNLLFATLLLEKPSPLFFLLKSSPVAFAVFPIPLYLRAGRSVYFQTINLKCSYRNICALYHLVKLSKISPPYYHYFKYFY